MKKLIFLLFCMACTNLFAQKITTFHRLLILNEQDKLMLVKLKNHDFWVTPGLYQNDHLTIKEGLDSIASTYGLTISDPELKGVFTLKSEVNGKKSLSTRNMFVVRTTKKETKQPDIITEVKWLSINEASDLLTFPHISIMASQVIKTPENTWGGALFQWKEGDQFKAKVVEEFSPLFPLSHSGN